MSVPVDGVDGALLDVVEDDGADEERREAERHRRHVQHAEGVAGICKRCTMARIQTAKITFENVAICCSSKRASLE